MNYETLDWAVNCIRTFLNKLIVKKYNEPGAHA